MQVLFIEAFIVRCGKQIVLVLVHWLIEGKEKLALSSRKHILLPPPHPHPTLTSIISSLLNFCYSPPPPPPPQFYCSPSTTSVICTHLITDTLRALLSLLIVIILDTLHYQRNMHAFDNSYFTSFVELVNLCNARYRNGIRGHMKAVVLSLLRQYLNHEVLFNEGIIIICMDVTGKHKQS